MEPGYVIILMFWPRSWRMEKHELCFVCSELLTTRICFGKVFCFLNRILVFQWLDSDAYCIFEIPCSALLCCGNMSRAAEQWLLPAAHGMHASPTLVARKKSMQTQVAGSHFGSHGSGKFGICSCALMFFHTSVAAHYVFLFFVCLGCVKIKCQVPK